MKKRFFGLFSLMILLLWLPSLGWAEDHISLSVNGNSIKLDVSPKIIKGRTLVPVRVISENMGMEVEWNNQKREVTLRNNQTEIEITIDHPTAIVNGKKVKLDQPPVIYQDRTFVPLRFIGESLGATVKWDPQLRSVTVNDAKSNVTKDAARLLDVKLTSDGFELESDRVMSSNSFTLDSPNRLVIDLKDTVLSQELAEQINKGTLFSNANLPSFLQGLRASQFSINPFITRIVFELGVDDIDHNVKQTGKTISVEFASYKKKQPPATSDTSMDQGTNTSTYINTDKGTYISSKTSAKADSFKIVVDAGHGGKDGGAIGIGGNLEKDFTLALAEKVKKALQKNSNFEVLLTRSDDSYPTLQERVQLANESNADLFLSIHANSAQPQARGTEVYYTTAKSKEFATQIHHSLVEATGFPDRGVKRSSLYVTKNTNMPSTLIEVGFITNASDNAEMLKPEFQEQVAEKVSAAMSEYIKNNMGASQ